MNIAVLGAGKVGRALGNKWLSAGHTICYGVRDPQKPEVLELVKASGGRVSASDLADAIQFGEVVVFAILGTAMDATITTYGDSLNGKLVVDAANKVASPVRNSLAAFAAHAPGAQVFRVFNHYGWENFVNPDFGGIRPDIFYCGPDGEPRTKMEQLISEVGFDPLYLGGADQVDVVDSLFNLWFAMVRGRNMGRHLTLKVLRD